MFESEWHSEKVERHLQAAQVFPFGISYLDDALVGIFPNDLILVGARTGRGKTELATTLAFNAAAKSKNVSFFALEADKLEIQRRIKYRKLAAMYHANYANSSTVKLRFPRYVEWLTQGYVEEWDALEQMAEKELGLETASLQIHYMGSKYTVNQFANDMESIKDDTELIIIDHLHYFDLADARNEFDGLKRAIHKIRDLSVHDGIPIVLLAHLRKGFLFPTLDDFHGHSDIVKLATTVILLAPAEDESVGHFPTYFHIAKARKAAEATPYVATMGFDRETNSYKQKYFLSTSNFQEKPKAITESGRVPLWAKRAKREFTFAHPVPDSYLGGKTDD